MEAQPTRAKKDWCRDPLPIGTVRVHSGVRRIKVSMREPKSRQWMDYARWWWLGNRGPVPEGKRVAHADGNMLNDDPANLVLVTPGDVVFMWHDRNPRGSKRNFAKLREVTARRNAEAAQIRRAREWLPSKWYAVDLARHIIYNRPARKRIHVFADWGITGKCPNGKGLESAALGWPEVSGVGAMAMTASIKHGWLSRLKLVDAVNVIRRDFGFTPATWGAILQARLFQDGWMERRRGRGFWEYHVTQRAIEERNTPLEIVPIGGSVLIADAKFRLFEKRTKIDLIDRSRMLDRMAAI